MVASLAFTQNARVRFSPVLLDALITQWLEYQTFNLGVVGSSPTGGTVGRF